MAIWSTMTHSPQHNPEHVEKVVLYLIEEYCCPISTYN